ncbi:hypothetical protein Bbelb_376020 [Branchiostoma belcheri]|nr:hypothetical protein Bbelb_376020 [Branchiostoma belcheri]
MPDKPSRIAPKFTLSRGRQAQQNRPQVYPVARPGCNQTRALSLPVETGNQAIMPDKPSRIAPKFTLSRGLATRALSRPVETGNQAIMPDKPSRIAPKFTLSRGRTLNQPVETGNQAIMPDKPSRIAPKFTLSRGLAVTRLD